MIKINRVPPPVMDYNRLTCTPGKAKETHPVTSPTARLNLTVRTVDRRGGGVGSVAGQGN